MHSCTPCVFSIHLQQGLCRPFLSSRGMVGAGTSTVFSTCWLLMRKESWRTNLNPQFYGLKKKHALRGALGVVRK